MKYLLGGALVTLGIFKLNDLINTQPKFGIPLTMFLALVWIIEVLKEFYKGRK